MPLPHDRNGVRMVHKSAGQVGLDVPRTPRSYRAVAVVQRVTARAVLVRGWSIGLLAACGDVELPLTALGAVDASSVLGALDE
jgi:hypothetical protein